MEKTTDMLIGILNSCTQEELEEDDETTEMEEDTPIEATTPGSPTSFLLIPCPFLCPVTVTSQAQ